MSTHSSIIVAVKKEDLGKVLKFNSNELEQPEMGWDDDSNDVKGNEETIEITNKYIGIYCHWDGYIEGVGYLLKKYFNTYEKALNLVLGGFCSSIKEDGSIQRFATRKGENGEEWEDIKPVQSNSSKELAEEEFCYLFKGGKWKCLDRAWKEY